MARKAKDTPHLRLRIEPSLLARLQKSADKNERTLTGEIVDRLDASFRRDDMQDYINATAKKIAENLLAQTSPASIQAMADEQLKYLRENRDRLPKAVERKIIADELFELDLKVLTEHYPDTPVEEHARYLREAAARRNKIRGDQQ